MRKEEGTSLDKDMVRGKGRVAQGRCREGKVQQLITSIDKSKTEIRRRK